MATANTVPFQNLLNGPGIVWAIVQNEIPGLLERSEALL